jgi:hypothetical protein
MDDYRSESFEWWAAPKEDKEIKVARILLGKELVHNVDWFIVHEAQINGRKRYIVCPEDSSCPWCRSGGKPFIKLFLAMQDPDTEEVGIWERGQKFIPQLQSLLKSKKELCERLYEVERHGQPGDKRTTYKLLPLRVDNVRYSEVEPLRPEVVSDSHKTWVMNVEAEVMEAIHDGSYADQYMTEEERNAGRQDNDERGYERSYEREGRRSYGDSEERSYDRGSRGRGAGYGGPSRDSRNDNSLSDSAPPERSGRQRGGDEIF